MRKVEFANREIYHVYNRGVEKRDIFVDESDYYRFIYGLYEFNDEQAASNTRYRSKSINKPNNYPIIMMNKASRLPLVDILVFTLMPNHYHLMLRQVNENGITRFMRKLGTGYTMYFNKKYDRSGVLFQGKFKAEHLHKKSHFLHLPHYIHTNPLQLNTRGRTSIEYLMEYRWSSFRDYAGKSSFPFVTSRDFLIDSFGGEQGVVKYTSERIGLTEVRPR